MRGTAIRALRRWAAVLLPFTLLTACSLGTSGTPSTGGTGGGNGQPVTLSVWSWRTQVAPLWQKVERAMKSQGLNVHIDYVTKIATQYDAIVRTAMTGGQGPDIFYGRAGSAGRGVIDYAAANMVLPLDGKVDLGGVSQPTLSTVAYKGKHYGVPFSVETMQIYYDKEVFQKYGLQPPKTWQQLLDICKKLKDAGVQPFYAMGSAQQWLLALSAFEIGASTVSNEWSRALVDRKVQFTSPQWVRVLSKFKDLSQYFEPNFMASGASGTESAQALALGRAAMIFDGTFDVPAIQGFNSSLRLGSFLVPPDDAATVSRLPGPAAYWTTKPRIFWYADGGFVVNANIKDKAVRDAAMKVIHFTAGRQFAQWFSNTAGEISPISGVQIPKSFPLSVNAYNLFQTDRVDPTFGLRGPLDITPPQPPTSAGAPSTPTALQGSYAATQDAVVAMLTGKITPDQAAAQIQSKLGWYFKS